MTSGNPHYVPYYEDYEPDTPYPGLISGKTYDWWERTPYPGQHFIEHYARGGRPILDLGRAVLPTILAVGQVGYTGYITAEQARQKALQQDTKEKLDEAVARIPKLLGDTDTTWDPKERKRRAKAEERERAARREARAQEVEEQQLRRDNVAEPQPFAPPGSTKYHTPTGSFPTTAPGTPGTRVYTPAGESSFPPTPRGPAEPSIAESMAAAEREVRAERQPSGRNSPKGKEPMHTLTPATHPYLVQRLTGTRIRGVVIPKSTAKYPGYYPPSPKTKERMNRESEKGAAYAGTHSLEETQEYLRTEKAGEDVIRLFSTAGEQQAVDENTFIPDPVKQMTDGRIDRIHEIRMPSATGPPIVLHTPPAMSRRKTRLNPRGRKKK